MGCSAEKIRYPFRREPEYFAPIVGLIVSAFGAVSKANDKDIAKKVGGMSQEAADKLYSNAAVSDALLAEMKPLQKNNTFYIIAGVALVLLIITGIIIYKRK